ncbi:TonB-dependent receptor [Roseateles cavernae]|uniref:TonB-dependent receptor n=1 Tax=Roseateles cavernae TaxID=3153578 RepID=UPI0032E3E018
MKKSPVRPCAVLAPCAGAVLTLLGTLAAAAEVDPPSTAPTTELRPVLVQGVSHKAGGLKAPQLTASRLALSALDTPASIESIDVSLQQARGDTRVADTVGRATGIAVQASATSGSTYSSRGFTGNESVASAEDGLRMATASGTQSTPTDSWGYERIEILRGPASVLYGDGSIGGLVNLVRKAPGREAGAELTAGLGTAGDYRLGLGLNQPLSAGTALRVDALATGGDGHVQRGDHRHHKLMSTLRWQATPDLRLDLSLDAHRERPTNHFGTPLKADGSLWAELRRENYNVSDALWQVDQDRARARLDWRISDSLSARAVAYRFQADRQWRNLEEYSLAQDGQQIERMGYLGIQHRLRQSGLRADLLARLGAVQALVGVEHMALDFVHANDRYEYSSVSRVPLQGFDPGLYKARDALLPRSRSEVDQQALFAEASWQAAPRWLLSLGLRRDRTRVDRENFNPAPGTALPAPWAARFSPSTWRLGTVFQLDATQSLYAQASTGTDPVGNVVSISSANKDLRLTEGRQLELGYKRAGAGLEWTAALFEIVKDHIITSPRPNRPDDSVQGGSQRSRGLELGAVWTPAPGWRVDANTALVQARYEHLFVVNAAKETVSLAGHRPPNVPERLANLWLSHSAGAYEIGAGLRHVGQRFTNRENAMSLAAYTVLDASLGWRFSEAASLRLQLRNLGDKLYASSMGSGRAAMLGAPRSAALVLDWRLR